MIRMSNRIRTQFAGVIGLVCAVAGAASATPLPYQVVQAESNLFARITANSSIDVEPDLTNTFPFVEPLSGLTNTQPSGFSKLTADVGLPGGFANGANGITFSELVLNYQNLPGTLLGTASVPLPLSPLGSPILFLTLSATITDLTITLNSPFTSPLAPGANPDEWEWAGVADVTISGNLKPSLTISAVPGIIPFPDTPFLSQAVQLPLAGLFSGIPGGTRVDVGIPNDQLQNQDLSLPPISVPIDQIPGFLLDIDITNLLLADINSSTVFRNLSQPIPEPNTALLLGLGLVGIAHRRRSR